MHKKELKNTSIPKQIFFKGDHVIYKGNGKLKGLKGVVIQTVEDKFQEEPIHETLFYDDTSKDDIQDLCVNVMPSNLEKYEPELAYPPIYPVEDSILLGAGWNITLAWNIITKDREVLDVPRRFIESFYEQCLAGMDQPEQKMPDGSIRIPVALIDIDKEKALSDKTDLSIPLILTKLGKSNFPIDGRHRMYKAYHTNQPLKAYVLTPAENRIIKLW